jgi:quinol-cytochrome oxidoreductase complex cytochrome b subunit
MPHQASSTNESRLRSDKDTRVSFHPHPVTKDLLTLTYAFASSGFIVFYNPELFNHSVNYIAANILVTPSHIVPERYFLPYHATPRPISNKVIGISAMPLSITIFYLFPVVDCGSGIPKTLDIHHRRFLRLFTRNFVSPGFLGSETAEFPCVEFGTFSTIMYLVLVSIVPPSSMHTHNLFGRVHNTK